MIALNKFFQASFLLTFRVYIPGASLHSISFYSNILVSLRSWKQFVWNDKTNSTFCFVPCSP